MKYITKQKESILNILKEHQDNILSAKKLKELLNDNVSKATLYRNLDELFNEGVINRFYNEALNIYEYQYKIADNDCQHHLHFKCNNCGKIFHLKELVTNNLFVVDYAHSLICGVCKNCLEG